MVPQPETSRWDEQIAEAVRTLAPLRVAVRATICMDIMMHVHNRGRTSEHASERFDRRWMASCTIG